ncbi:hypothetical protein [Halobellus ordinarius]|uniref:hypothetical protein n=1 Tax=Halobellus ordinarius TaxID=3075120 RepID=UPI0028807E74|nr:hypothetical protein [Halobellus sp. ZY16]
MRMVPTPMCAAMAMVFGLVGAAFPRRVLDTAGRFLLAGYENPEDLEPSDWYVAATRAQFGLSALAGGLVLALEYGRGDGNDGSEADADAE